jgi:hypothetical protein
MMRFRMMLVALGITSCLMTLPTQATAQKKQRDVITREELMSNTSGDRNLYEVIRQLRPHMLQARPGVRTLGGSNQVGLAVFIDRKRDDIEVLRTLRPELVEEVRYFDPAKAESEFGFSAGGGAVMVKLYKPPRDTVSG